MREVSRHLFIPRRPLIASMLSSDPERSWIRIVKASLISPTRPALTSASAPFAMARRFPLPARRSFASIDRVMGSISGLWLPPPASSAELDAEFVRDRRFRLAQSELNADFRLRRRGAAFPQHARRMGNGVFVEVDRHRDETALRIPGGIHRDGARGHEPFGFERENAISGRNLHGAEARWRCRSRRR
jgi:hypothetical protein